MPKLHTLGQLCLLTLLLLGGCAKLRPASSAGSENWAPGYTQATIVVVENNSVVTGLAAGRPITEYVHPVIRAGARASCAYAEYRFGNLGSNIPASATYQVRYRDESFGSATFTNQGGFLVGRVPLRDGQAGLLVPNALFQGANDPVVSVRILDVDGWEAPLSYLPAQNRLNAVITQKETGGGTNELLHSLGRGLTMVAIVPKGFCGHDESAGDAK